MLGNKLLFELLMTDRDTNPRYHRINQGISSIDQFREISPVLAENLREALIHLGSSFPYHPSSERFRAAFEYRRSMGVQDESEYHPRGMANAIRRALLLHALPMTEGDGIVNASDLDRSFILRFKDAAALVLTDPDTIGTFALALEAKGLSHTDLTVSVLESECAEAFEKYARRAGGSPLRDPI